MTDPATEPAWSPASPSRLFYQAGDRRPLLDRAEGIYLWTRDGRRLIDASSGAMVSNLGHSNRRVLDAMGAQMERATFGYRLHVENEPAERLAHVLAASCPVGLERVFFASGGSEAVESAVKLARQHALAAGQPRRVEVISRYPSYHGSTLGALALTGYDPLTEPFAPMLRPMPKVPAPTAYLDRDDLDDAARGLRYAELLREKILALGPDTVLAFIMEPVGGASTGALVAPDSYYQRVRDICDEFGVLLIYDEVMSGAGRTGRFLAAEHWRQTPDIVALAKGLGAGYVPLGAVVAREDIVAPVLAGGGFMHGFTAAGNPLACAAGLAVIGELTERGLMDNATAVGALLTERLQTLMARFPFIGDVRGRGLLLALELVEDRGTMAPLPPAFNAHERLVQLAFERDLILYARRTRGGRAGDHVLVCPPLITTPAQAEDIIDRLEDALGALGRAIEDSP